MDWPRCFTTLNILAERLHLEAHCSQHRVARLARFPMIPAKASMEALMRDSHFAD